MSAHRRHRRYESSKLNENKTKSNLDLNNVLGLLNNVDFNQIAGLLRNFNIGSNQINSQPADTEGTTVQNKGSTEKRAEISQAIQTIINSDKAELLQVLIQLYSASKSTQN